LTREEFIGLVPDVQEPLRRFLLVLCEGDAASADDLAQEALVSAYVASGTFRGASSFRTWVFRIAYHCFIDRIRARKVRTEPLDAFMDAPLPAPDASDGGFRHEALYRALRQLPVLSIEAELMDISSTEIRRRIKAGESISGMVPQAVEDFIRKEGLYA